MSGEITCDCGRVWPDWDAFDRGCGYVVCLPLPRTLTRAEKDARVVPARTRVASAQAVPPIPKEEA